MGRRLQSERTMNQPLYLKTVKNVRVQGVAEKPDPQEECHVIS